MRKVFEYRDDDANYVDRAIAAWSAMTHCTSGIVVVIVELEATEIDEDPTAGFTYCIEKGSGWE